MGRFIKFLLALVLLPTVFWGLMATGKILTQAWGSWQGFLPFVLGVCAYACVHYSLYDFSRMYVLGHEMTHALTAFLCGARIKDISVQEESGYVKMNKTNVFIVLSPYFIPGYVLLIAFLYRVGDLFVDVTPYRFIFVFGVGFFTAFHFIQTFKTLFEADQPDLKLAGGKVFSIVMIILANLMVLTLVLKGLFPEQVSLRLAGEEILKGTLNTWRILVNYTIEHLISNL